MTEEMSIRPKQKRGQDSACLNWLYFDLNSYFASVEQQLHPQYRKRPLIVTPVDADASCAIAASYEARAFGIRTGTKVYDAKRMCPGLIMVPARHDVYVDYHHRIMAEVERHLHVTHVHSIDEAACLLMGEECRTENAVALARQIQADLLRNVGECLRASIGLGPSSLLAKVASDMQKPAGLTVLGADQLPHAIEKLSLTDIAGIGKNMKMRLYQAGIFDIKTFWDLPPSRARAVWGSIQGERFWYAIHGVDPPELVTHTSSISHSHVLGPDLRHREGGHLVARKLTARAAARLRRAGFKTGRLNLWLKAQTGKRDVTVDFSHTADSFALLSAMDAAWHKMVRPNERLAVHQVGLAFLKLVDADSITPDLFGWRPDWEESPKRLALSKALDDINARYGRDAVAIGPAPKSMSRYVGAKIAFNRIPQKKDFD